MSLTESEPVYNMDAVRGFALSALIWGRRHGVQRLCRARLPSDFLARLAWSSSSRSTRELREGDRVYCLPCMSRLVVRSDAGHLEARVVY